MSNEFKTESTNSKTAHSSRYDGSGRTVESADITVSPLGDKVHLTIEHSRHHVIRNYVMTRNEFRDLVLAVFPDAKQADVLG